MISTTVERSPKIVYWHRDLPPLAAESIGEHTVEATSSRVHDGVAHRYGHWLQCEDELMACTRHRLAEEIVRLGGRCAHVYKETIDARHDDATGEAWLQGRFEYTLYR
jgi:hypothetical protein